MRFSLPLALALVGACSGAGGKSRSQADTLVVFEAASLAVPMRAALDSFSRAEHVTVQDEHGASLELARRITDLQRVPDLVALADREVFPERLIPKATTWYAEFARNRMVVIFTPKSRLASEISTQNWRQVLARAGVLVGRTDPVLAPVGYRTLITYKLAERFYGEPGLAKRLEALTPPSLIRANATDLAALLTAGELDYIIDYESLAHAQGLKFVSLPPEIDLGDAARASTYAAESVTVATRTGNVVRAGAPILYGLSVPALAPHRSVGEKLAKFILAGDGRSLLRTNYVDVLDSVRLVGDSIPALLKTP